MAWTNKSRVQLQTDRGRLLTPDNNQILLGSSEDEVLIYQEASDGWSNKQRNTA